MDEENKDKINPFPSTIENTTIILEQMKKCVCKIESQKGNATAFFCYITYLDKKYPTLMTNNHIINEEILCENNIIRVIINDGKEKKNIDISEKRKIYTNIKYDITIIEIKPEKDKIYNFLEIDKFIFNENINFFNESIYILHYQKYGKEQKSSVSYGIIKLLEDDYHLKYYCYADSGSSGGPIMNLLNNKIIGIHKESSIYNFNKGTLLKYPIHEYINNFNLINKNRMENNNKIKVDEIKKKNKIKKNNKFKNEIYMLLKIENEDINKNIYFLDNSPNHDNLKELKDSNVTLSINNFKSKFKKYFKPEKEGAYYIKLKFKNNIKDCSYMFYKCNNLKNVDLSCFETKNVNNMRYMFCDCNNLENINLTDFNSEKVKDMSLMFYNCCNLIKIDLSFFEIGKVEDIHWMFFDCNNLKNIKIKENFYNKIKDELNGFKNLKIIFV